MKSLLACFIFLAFSANHYSQNVSSGRQDAIGVIQDADLLIRGGAFEDALLKYNEAILLDDTYAKAYMKRARLLFKIGRVTEANADYDRAIALNPYSEYIFNERAKIKYLAFDYDGSVNDIKFSPKIRNQDRDLLIDDYIALKKYKEALTEIDTLLSTDYNSSMSLLKKSIVYLLENNFKEANEYVDLSIQRNPDNALSYDVKGIIALEQNDFDYAIENFNIAVLLNPNFEFPYLHRSKAYVGLNKFELALKDLQTAMDLSKANTLAIQAKKSEQNYDFKSSKENDIYISAIYNRALINKALGSYRLALDDAKQVLKLKEENERFWNLKGNMHMLFSEYEEAIDAFKEAISYKPDYAVAHYNLGLAYIVRFQYADGCTYLQRSSDMGYEPAIKALRFNCQ